MNLFQCNMFVTISQMPKKGKDFYYLLPGQGRGARKRHFRNLVVATVVGLLTSGLIFGIFYALER
jgi:hypothetical protein